eukprot:GFUD01018520.1.p1 GENE.GFUD01018520.1~~GFUD01018520.1.p1  ORF type:complete len:581 (-),score=109.13 GFUD01018520.1:68-1810(-)
MLFDSWQANLLLFFSISTIVLWNGPARLVPGYKDGLPVAKTKQGLARGDMWTSRDGRYFNVFRGIPYAKIPTGERRFKPPEPLDAKDRWEGAKDFNWEMPHCYQVDMITGFHIGREDCLKLSVFTPEMSPETPLPVMVWIHGGGFVIGDSGTAITGPHYFMDQDVVLVTLHYRLGPLGFLSLGNEKIAGNQGLWDQRMALQWVKRNIKSFGGDPKKVTIFGESAGSMAVNFHLLSPQSKGLFSKAIMQSGTALSTFIKSSKHSARDGHKFAEAVGCRKETEIVECLQTVPLKSLYASLLMFDQDCPLREDVGLAFLGPWKPSVDSFIEKPFLPKDPEDILKNGEDNNVPAIVGFNQEDGLLFTTRFLKDPDIGHSFIENQKICGPIYFLGKEKELINEKDIEQSERLIQSYSNSETNATFAELTDLFTDSVFGVGSHKLSNYLVENKRRVFKYIFSYSGSSSLGDFFSDTLLEKAYYFLSRIVRLYPTRGLGACHADDLIYLFQMTPIINMIPSSADRKVSEDLVKMWVNFARRGDPNSEGEQNWKQADLENEFDYFVIDEHSRMETRKELKRFENWVGV